MLVLLRRLAMILVLGGLCAGCGGSTPAPEDISPVNVGAAEFRMLPPPPSLPPPPRPGS